MATWKKLVYEDSSGELAQNAASSTTTSGIDILNKLKYESDLISIGADSAGVDVKFFGDGSSKYMLWDASSNQLSFEGGAQFDAGSTMVMSGDPSIILAGVGDLSLSAAADVLLTSAVAGSLTFTTTNGVAFKVDGDGDIEVGTDDNDSAIHSQGTTRALILAGGGAGPQDSGTAHIKLGGLSNGNIYLNPGGTGNVISSSSLTLEAGKSILLSQGSFQASAVNGTGIVWLPVGDGNFTLGHGDNNGPSFKCHGEASTGEYLFWDNSTLTVDGTVDFTSAVFNTHNIVCEGIGSFNGDIISLVCDNAASFCVDEGGISISAYTGTSYEDTNPYQITHDSAVNNNKTLQFLGALTKTLDIRLVDGDLRFGDGDPANALITNTGNATFQSVTATTVTASGTFNATNLTATNRIQGATVKSEDGLYISEYKFFDDSDVEIADWSGGNLKLAGSLNVSGARIKDAAGNIIISWSGLHTTLAGDLSLVGNTLTFGNGEIIDCETADTLTLTSEEVLFKNPSADADSRLIIDSPLNYDSMIVFKENDVDRWLIGVDNGDGDSLKFNVGTDDIGVSTQLEINTSGDLTSVGNITLGNKLIFTSYGAEIQSNIGYLKIEDPTDAANYMVLINNQGATHDSKISFSKADIAKWTIGNDGTDDSFKISRAPGTELESDTVLTIETDDTVTLAGNLDVSDAISFGGTPTLTVNKLTLGTTDIAGAGGIMTIGSIRLDGEDRAQTTGVLYIDDNLSNDTNRNWNIHQRNVAGYVGDLWIEHRVVVDESGVGLNMPVNGWYHPIRIDANSGSDAIIITASTWDDDGDFVAHGRVEMEKLGVKEISYQGGTTNTIDINDSINITGDITVSGDISDGSGNLRVAYTAGDFITLTVHDFNVEAKDEDNMASNSATHLATQQSIKAYSDTKLAKSGGTMSGDIDMDTNGIDNLKELIMADGEDGISLDGGGVYFTSFLNESDMASDDASAICSQESIKAYVDAQTHITALNSLSDVTYDGTDLTITDLETIIVAGDFLLESEGSNLSLKVGSGGLIEFHEGGTLGLRHDASSGSTKFTSDANNYFEIDVAPDGVTSLLTLDGGVDSVGHLTIVPDGDLVFSAASGRAAYFKDTSAGFERKEIVAAPTTAIDFRLGNKYHLDIIIYSGITVNLQFPSTSGNFILVVQQDSPGGRTITTWAAKDTAGNTCDNDGGTAGAIRWAGGTVPTLSTAANSRDVMSFYWDADEEVCYGMPSLDFS